MLRRHLSGVIALVLSAGAVNAAVPLPQRTFAYAPSSGADGVTVWQVEGNGTTLRAAGMVRHPIGTRAPVEVVLQPSGTFAYVIHAPSAEHGSAISLHRVDPRTGRLEFRSSVLEAEGAIALVLDPSGRHAYVADAERAALRTFSVDPTLGTWRERHAPMPTGSGPCQVLIHPHGTFLFVLNRKSCSVSRYRLDANGRPELSGEDVLLNGSRPVRALMDPSGARLYVSVETYDVLLSMSIDVRDGGLRTINAAGTGSSPSGLALNSNGERIFVAERGSGSLSAFDIDPASGRLGARLGPFPAGSGPTNVTLAADGRTLWITGEGQDLRSFLIDEHSTATPGVTRRTSGPLGPLAGLAQEVTSGVAPVALVLHEDGTLSARREARGTTAAVSKGAYVGGELAAEQVVGSVDGYDELVVDPHGTWVIALGHRPGRFALSTVDSYGRFGPPSPPIVVGPEVAVAAVAPGGCLLAVATRTPASVHMYSLLGEAVQHLHSLPLSAAPDGLVFDTTERALFVAHTAADRLTAIALDEAGFMVRSTALALEGGPGPLALAPTGDVLFVGLRNVPGVVPCDIGALPQELVVRTGLGVELPWPPARLDFAQTGEALLASFSRGSRAAPTGELAITHTNHAVRIDRHPETGALCLRAGQFEALAAVGVLAASAPQASGLRRGSEGERARSGGVRATARIELALPRPRVPDPRVGGPAGPPTPSARVAAESERAQARRD